MLSAALGRDPDFQIVGSRLFLLVRLLESRFRRAAAAGFVLVVVFGFGGLDDSGGNYVDFVGFGNFVNFGHFLNFEYFVYFERYGNSEDAEYFDDSVEFGSFVNFVDSGEDWTDYWEDRFLDLSKHSNSHFDSKLFSSNYFLDFEHFYLLGALLPLEFLWNHRFRLRFQAEQLAGLFDHLVFANLLVHHRWRLPPEARLFDLIVLDSGLSDCRLFERGTVVVRQLVPNFVVVVAAAVVAVAVFSVDFDVQSTVAASKL